ncbi:MAG TPA: phosphoglycerate dehydrogenase, partial [Alphaproteobacteria bacterium]|nr:phosphoglycerate dehydrogenase [Alphaproteobacteria bacterium]
MPKVLIADKMSPLAEKIFRSRGIDVDVKAGLEKDELNAIIGNYDGVAVRSATKVRADAIARGEKLKVIGRAGIGVDTIDVPAATAKG